MKVVEGDVIVEVRVDVVGTLVVVIWVEVIVVESDVTVLVNVDVVGTLVVVLCVEV